MKIYPCFFAVVILSTVFNSSRSFAQVVVVQNVQTLNDGNGHFKTTGSIYATSGDTISTEGLPQNVFGNNKNFEPIDSTHYRLVGNIYDNGNKLFCNFDIEHGNEIFHITFYDTDYGKSRGKPSTHTFDKSKIMYNIVPNLMMDTISVHNNLIIINQYNIVVDKHSREYIIDFPPDIEYLIPKIAQTLGGTYFDNHLSFTTCKPISLLEVVSEEVINGIFTTRKIGFNMICKQD